LPSISYFRCSESPAQKVAFAVTKNILLPSSSSAANQQWFCNEPKIHACRSPEVMSDEENKENSAAPGAAPGAEISLLWLLWC
jgi:hypothetical protein